MELSQMKFSQMDSSISKMDNCFEYDHVSHNNNTSLSPQIQNSCLQNCETILPKSHILLENTKMFC